MQGINFLVPLLVMPYVISRVGADGFGAIAVAQVLMIYLAAISDYGFNISATKDIALYKGDHQKLSKIFFTVLASRLFITIVLMVILFAMVFFTPLFKHHAALYTFGFTYVVGQALFVNWFFQGLEKMHYITGCTLLSRLIFVVLVFMFIRQQGDEFLFLFFLGIGNIFAGLLSVFIAISVSKLAIIFPSRKDILYEIKEGWQITVSNLSINTYLYSSVFILRIFTNDLVVGYYSIAERIFFAVRQVLAVFSQVIYPQICQFSQKGKEAGRIFFRQVYTPFFLATITGCALLFVFSPWVIHLFIKDGSTLPVSLLRLLCIVPIIVCLNIPAYQLLLAFGPKKSYLKVFSIATIINIIVNIVLVNVWGATGTVCSIIITELFITIGLNVELYKNKLAEFINPGTV